MNLATQTYDHLEPLIKNSDLLEVHNIPSVLQRDKQKQVILNMTGNEKIILNVIFSTGAKFLRIVRLVNELLDPVSGPFN